MYIDSYEKLQLYKSSVKDSDIVVTLHLVDDRLHSTKNDILALYVHDLQSKREYIFPYKHPESIFKEYVIEDVLCAKTNYVHNSIQLKYNKINVSYVDAGISHYLATGEEIDIDSCMQSYHFRRLYPSLYKTGYLQSLTTFVEQARELVSLTEIATNGLEFYNDVLLNTFYFIESSGIVVNQDSFTAQYGKPINYIGNKVYSKYNFFTATGRPSNRFGGINFAALNKSDDTRSCFISGHKNGKLVEIDFKAYHPHIIAWLCDYDFGNEDVYEHLAKHYNNTQTPSQDEIKDAKEATFNQLYGGINKKYLHVEFFKRAKEFATNLFNKYNELGYMESALSGRRLYKENMTEMNAAKLFNYYIQMTETELNGLFLQKLFKDINLTKTTPILYTYDALLFDCSDDSIDGLVDKIKCNLLGNFPITVKVGDNYKEMINYEGTATLYI